jgi:hypothetical protein
MHPAVERLVGDLGAVLDVVEVIVPLELGTKTLDLMLHAILGHDRLRRRAKHRSLYRRFADRMQVVVPRESACEFEHAGKRKTFTILKKVLNESGGRSVYSDGGAD